MLKKINFKGNPGISRKGLLIFTTALALGLVTVLISSIALAAPKSPVTRTPVTSSAPQTINIPLVAGLNLISMPVIPTDPTIATVMGAIAANVNSVWAYDANTGIWSSWNPTLGGDLTQMADGQGYWIDMISGDTLAVTGSAVPGSGLSVPPTYNAVTGWNLIGFTEISAETVQSYLQNGTTPPATNFRVPIYGYGAGSYTTISAVTDNFQPGAGYWVYFNSNGVITP